MIRFVLALLAVGLIGVPAFAKDGPVQNGPVNQRPFSLTAEQAQEYANRLQAEIKQLQAALQADAAILDDLAKQAQATQQPAKK